MAQRTDTHRSSITTRPRSSCFVISPIGRPRSSVRKHADAVLERIIEPALSRFNYRPNRFDKSGESGRITERMVRQILKSPLCIAVLTGLNPNVMYEVGVRHAWDLPIILLARKGTDLPFDLRDCNTVYYSLGKSEEAVDELRRQIDGIQEEINGVEAHKPIRMQAVFSEGMEELSQVRSLGVLFRTKEKILESLIERLSEIKNEIHAESPIDGAHESKSMARVAELAVTVFDHLATKVAVLETALKNVNHNATEHCRNVLVRMKGLQAEGVAMRKRWREAKGSYDDFRVGLDELQSLMDRGSEFLRHAR